jgi:hypothetical protein
VSDTHPVLSENSQPPATGRVGDYTSISNNVGSVKVFVDALAHALGEERHFALIESIHATNQYQGSLVIFRAELSPTQRIMEGRPLK